MGSAAYVPLFVVIFVAFAFPAFVIGRRRGVRNAWAAFIPLLGAWIVPTRHERSRWWTLALVIPDVNLISYWFYAFTPPRARADVLAA
jgi:cbb3-type cytochrome oxidase subunit 3